jgi:hypothetical protein
MQRLIWTRLESLICLFVRRVAQLDRILDVASLEDFSIQNDHTSVSDVARELLMRAGWLGSVENRST